MDILPGNTGTFLSCLLTIIHPLNFYTQIVYTSITIIIKRVLVCFKVLWQLAQSQVYNSTLCTLYRGKFQHFNHRLQSTVLTVQYCESISLLMYKHCTVLYYTVHTVLYTVYVHCYIKYSTVHIQNRVSELPSLLGWCIRTYRTVQRVELKIFLYAIIA